MPLMFRSSIPIVRKQRQLASELGQAFAAKMCDPLVQPSQLQHALAQLAERFTFLLLCMKGDASCPARVSSLSVRAGFQRLSVPVDTPSGSAAAPACPY